MSKLLMRHAGWGHTTCARSDMNEAGDRELAVDLVFAVQARMIEYG